MTTGRPAIPFEIVGTISFLYSSRSGILSETAAGMIHDFRSRTGGEGRPATSRASAGDFTLIFNEASQTFDQVFLLTSQELRRRAAALGAHAVIEMRHDVDLAASDRDCVYVDVTGTAVRFRV